MSKFLSVKNFEKFQHYKDRNPPWIKLYNDLFDDYAFACLQDASKMHLIGIWLLASRLDNKIPFDEKWIGAKINATAKVNLQELITAGFLMEIEGASNALADCKQNACLETETETETDISSSALKKKISLNELSVNHIADWLSEKRAQGRYLTHDEHFVLEKFKDYCRSKNPKYADYVAAYRNAFDWKQFLGGTNNGTKNTNDRKSPHEKWGHAWKQAAGIPTES